MNKSNTVAIIGPGRIGKIYLRELIKLKYSNFFLYGGKTKFDLKNLKYLENSLKQNNIRIKHFKHMNDSIKKCDLVCICSPSNTHLKYLKLLENIKAKIIVEKPLVTLEDLKKININDFLYQNIFKKKKVLCSYPVRFYSKEIKRILKLKHLKYLKFQYHTIGKNTYKDIPEDLLPHAFSFIYEFFKNKVKNIKNLKKKQFENNWNCNFQIENTKIFFDFKQNIKGKKSKLNIFLNNFKITRESKILSNGDLDIFLKINKKRMKIKNPMSQNINYNNYKLLNNKNLLFDYKFNSNIIFLMKKFLSYEK